jgi:hypothetical protein
VGGNDPTFLHAARFLFVAISGLAPAMANDRGQGLRVSSVVCALFNGVLGFVRIWRFICSLHMEPSN